MSSQGGTEIAPANRDDRRDLRAEIRFDVNRSDCPLAATGDEDVLTHQIIEDVCYVVSDAADDDPSVRQTGTVMDGCCPCSIFRHHGCVPVLTSVDGDTVVVTTYLSDRASLRSLVDELRTVVDGVSLRRLTGPTGGEFSDVRSANLSLLSEIERETLTRAIEAGYYDDPRRIEFGTLAQRLDVSKPTLSQRLRSAESKLLLDLLGE
ncbi:helix-turn-helix domain-containing protein [Salinilacihabitans rarus]|uniref:helix-turn-helix domain-containing protein n=1 Tax=Salinilacihabitans rarus TaxID=2961596 RepID=UPI0020C88FA1|nr:helix-turn-helix domain-containing protein [Salinilacihabitans rarus]